MWREKSQLFPLPPSRDLCRQDRQQGDFNPLESTFWRPELGQRAWILLQPAAWADTLKHRVSKRLGFYSRLVPQPFCRQPYPYNQITCSFLKAAKQQGVVHWPQESLPWHEVERPPQAKKEHILQSSGELHHQLVCCCHRRSVTNSVIGERGLLHCKCVPQETSRPTHPQCHLYLLFVCCLVTLEKTAFESFSY